MKQSTRQIPTERVVPMFVVCRHLASGTIEFLHAQLTVDTSIWGPRKGALIFDIGAARRYVARELGANIAVEDYGWLARSA